MSSRKQLKKVAKNTFILQESNPKFSEKKIQEAYSQIAELTNDIHAKLKEAQDIADKFGLTFSLSIAYGMGGQYKGKGTEDLQYDYISKKYKNSTRKEGEWVSSTESCS